LGWGGNERKKGEEGKSELVKKDLQACLARNDGERPRAGGRRQGGKNEGIGNKKEKER